MRTERCEECGYDMTAMAAWARCPECGCGLRATFINGRPHPDYMESAGAAYRPVMWVVATGGAACLATSVVIGVAGRFTEFAVPAMFILVCVAAILLLGVAPIWAAVIAARRSASMRALFPERSAARTAAAVLGVALLTAVCGFSIGLLGCAPGCMTQM